MQAAEKVIHEPAEIPMGTDKKIRHFGETMYEARTWNTCRRIIVKAERLENAAHRLL